MILQTANQHLVSQMNSTGIIIAGMFILLAVICSLIHKNRESIEKYLNQK